MSPETATSPAIEPHALAKELEKLALPCAFEALRKAKGAEEEERDEDARNGMKALLNLPITGSMSEEEEGSSDELPPEAIEAVDELLLAADEGIDSLSAADALPLSLAFAVPSTASSSHTQTPTTAPGGVSPATPLRSSLFTPAATTPPVAQPGVHTFFPDSPAPAHDRPDQVPRGVPSSSPLSAEGCAEGKSPGDAVNPTTPSPSTPERGSMSARWRQRLKQVAIGKSTQGYANYLRLVPINCRVKGKHLDTPPVSPTKLHMHSKRDFEMVLRTWRKFLHKYDDSEIGEEATVGGGTGKVGDEPTTATSEYRPPGCHDHTPTSTSNSSSRVASESRSSHTVSSPSPSPPSSPPPHCPDTFPSMPPLVPARRPSQPPFYHHPPHPHPHHPHLHPHPHLGPPHPPMPWIVDGPHAAFPHHPAWGTLPPRPARRGRHDYYTAHGPPPMYFGRQEIPPDFADTATPGPLPPTLQGVDRCPAIYATPANADYRVLPWRTGSGQEGDGHWHGGVDKSKGAPWRTSKTCRMDPMVPGWPSSY